MHQDLETVKSCCRLYVLKVNCGDASQLQLIGFVGHQLEGLSKRHVGPDWLLLAPRKQQSFAEPKATKQVLKCLSHSSNTAGDSRQAGAMANSFDNGKTEFIFLIVFRLASAWGKSMPQQTRLGPLAAN